MVAAVGEEVEEVEEEVVLPVVVAVGEYLRLQTSPVRFGRPNATYFVVCCRIQRRQLCARR